MVVVELWEVKKSGEKEAVELWKLFDGREAREKERNKNKE